MKTTICGNKEYLRKLLAHSAFYKRNNFLFFSTYQGNKVNEYFLEMENEKCVFYRDSIEYTAVFPLTGTNACAYVMALQQRLDSFSIKEYRGEPDGLGTEMRLHMKDGDIVFYTKDVAQITYPATLEIIKKSQCLCENWYLEQY